MYGLSVFPLFWQKYFLPQQKPNPGLKANILHYYCHNGNNVHEGHPSCYREWYWNADALYSTI